MWAAHALPSVIALTELPADLTGPSLPLSLPPLDSSLASDGCEHIIELLGGVFRIHADESSTHPAAVLLPLDHLFEVRAAAAVRLWRGLTGRNPGRSPAALSRAHCDRHVLALRALDGRQARASYREIAGVLFDADDVSGPGWKTHDLRDRTIRLVRFGIGMMQDGYRRLLLHPYRRRA